MIGFIIQVIQDLVVSQHGKAAWAALCIESGLPETIEAQVAYDDDNFYRLAVAGSVALKVSLEALVEAIGYHFVVFTLRSEHANMFNLVGSTLPDILQNINNFHGHMKVSYFTKGMTPPNFRCTSIKENSMRLHYTPGRKSRHSLGPLIIGIIKALADLVVKDIASVEVTPEKNAVGSKSELFFVSWVKKSSGEGNSESVSGSMDEREFVWGLGPDALNTAFPFHIILDMNAEVVQAGSSMLKLVPLDEGETLDTHFQCVYPVNIELNKVTHLSSKERDVFLLEYQYDDSRAIQFKGQMIKYRFKGTKLIAFLCAPLVDTVADMLYFGLSISDFAVHDPTKDRVFASGKSLDANALREQLEQERKARTEMETRTGSKKTAIKTLLGRRGTKPLKDSTSASVTSRSSPTISKSHDEDGNVRPSRPSREPSASHASRKSSYEHGATLQSHGSGCPITGHFMSSGMQGGHQQQVLQYLQQKAVSVPQYGEPRSKRAGFALREALLRDAWMEFPIMFSVLDAALNQDSGRDVYAATIVFYHHHSKAYHVLQSATNREIAASISNAQLFLRTDSLLSRLIGGFLRMFNASWLEGFVRTVLKRLDNESEPTFTKDSPVVDDVFEMLCSSAAEWNTYVRSALQSIDNMVSNRLPAARLSALVNAIFLRFICPAIALPVKHQLVFSLSKQQEEACRLLSRHLQSVLNEVCADTASERRTKLDAFLVELVRTDSLDSVRAPTPSFSYTESVDIIRDSIAAHIPALVSNEKTRENIGGLLQSLLVTVDVSSDV